MASTALNLATKDRILRFLRERTVLVWINQRRGRGRRRRGEEGGK